MIPVLRTLTDSLIDYAGLFPPAALTMEQAVRNYDVYRHGEHRRMLGRYIVPLQRLEEFERAAAARLDEDPSPWHLSVIGSGDAAADSAIISAFNRRHEGGAKIDVVEIRFPDHGVEGWREASDDMTVYVEIPHDADDLEEKIETLRRAGLRAKIRTGGVVAEAFPEAESIARFIAACVARRVPFKATAGLHHPLRCRAALTYDADAQTGMMHGFVNLFLAAAFVYERHSTEEVAQLLAEQDPLAFRFSEHAIYWHDHEILEEVLAEVRRNVAISFGSCSFEEPVGDLRRLGWITDRERTSNTP